MKDSGFMCRTCDLVADYLHTQPPPVNRSADSIRIDHQQIKTAQKCSLIDLK